MYLILVDTFYKSNRTDEGVKTSNMNNVVYEVI